MILPLPVKKNKFGQRVDDISVNDYYRQIAEEVLEAHNAANNRHIVKILRNDGCGQCSEILDCNEPEELVDIITTCITRLDILHYYDDDEGLDQYLCDLVDDASYRIFAPQAPSFNCREYSDFYNTLFSYVMQAFSGSVTDKLIESDDASDEEMKLPEIIALCIVRLNFLGYDDDARQKLYQAVNDKNKSRGYFED